MMKPESQPPLSNKAKEERGDVTQAFAPPANSNAPRGDSSKAGFDATVAFDSALERSGKEDRDILFVLALMQSGQINSRQIARSIDNWTIYGHRALAEHLVSRGVITDEDRVQLEKVSLELLAECDTQPGSGLRARLHSLVGADTWEQLCRMLGIATTSESVDKEAPREALVEYAIVRRLGIGGLGSVWLARDQTLKRLVAIKEVNERGAESAVALARFRREAEITGQLEHPNIVPVYQSGEDTQSHRPFYVMRFVGKKTLADAIGDYHTRRAAGLADTVELHRLLGAFLSVCQAVAFAHSRGVLHRDLKPENVALGNFGQVIVLDWGLAKRTDDADWQDSAPGTLSGSTVEHTMAGQVLGTPHYMSPEQAAGRVECMDERTDVYGLGATLFAILTGYAPHEASQAGSTRSARGAELYAAIVDNPTPRCRDTLSEVPAPLDAICAKAMAAAPAARYAAASELAEDIQLWTAGQPVSAYQEPGTRQIGRLLRKHRTVSILAAAALVALMIPPVLLGYAANERRLAANQARMESLFLDGKGLSVNLAAAADNGRQNVRFMSRIPPIHGIMRARYPDVQNEDDEATWHERLETIYVGLLRANPDYLQISYCSLGDEPTEIVRVERNRFDRSYVEAAVESRKIELPDDAPERSVAFLKAGDVAVSDLSAPSDSPARAPTAGEDQPLTLNLAVPIYDETSGDLFGAVGLVIDLDYLLAKWARDTTAQSVLLADRRGAFLAAFQPETGRDPSWQIDVATARSLASFAESSRQELKLPATDEHPGGMFAIKVAIDPRRPQNVVIVAVRGG